MNAQRDMLIGRQNLREKGREGVTPPPPPLPKQLNQDIVDCIPESDHDTAKPAQDESLEKPKSIASVAQVSEEEEEPESEASESEKEVQIKEAAPPLEEDNERESIIIEPQDQPLFEKETAPPIATQIRHA